MSIESILRRGRKRREALMRSTCRILRPGSGDPVFDPETGEYTTPAETLVYEGPCRVRPTFSPAEQDGSSAERQLVTNAYNVEIPWTRSTETTPVDIADVVVMTGGDENWLTGKRLPVAWVEYSDTRTHRRLAVWTQERGGVTYG
ncbi:DUF6093 family protein [Pseudonocardia sp. NPDC049154]|uniref:DUF6093 family protein n=1 Tax=Pseudonocardia sp. NPDC049154 TaxID=3155501 RepID=UPI0033E7572B